MNTRKWLAECHAWLDDPTNVQLQTAEGQWIIADGLGPISSPEYLWRIKPATIMLNGCELSKPVPCDDFTKVRLTIGDAWLTIGDALFWFNTSEDRDLVYAKLVEVLS